MARLSTSREKARIAAGQQFAISQHSSLGDALIGSWSFESGSYEDDSGSGLGGTPIGSPTIINDPTKGNVLRSASSGKLVSIDHNNLLIPDATLTISAWIKVSPNGSNGQSVAFKDDGTITKRPYIFGVQRSNLTSGNKLAIGVNNSIFQYYGNTVVTDNMWHHVSVTVNLISKYIIFYIDGKEDKKTNIPGLPNQFSTNNPTSLYIGVGINDLIDDVRIYSDAFNSAQIRQIYAEGLEAHKITKLD